MARYINFPIEVNPSVLLKRAFDYLAAVIPGWTPAEGNLDVWVLEATSTETAELASVASRVPDTLFRYFGKSIAGLPTVDATAATVNTTWTMRDATGYTVPAGTQVGMRDADGVLIPFITINAITVPPGSSITAVGAITIAAIDPGATGSGLGGVGANVELIDTLDFVLSIVSTAATSGGQDAETDGDYLNRLVLNLQLMTRTPILPNDFAKLALNIPPTYRAVAIDGWNPDYLNEKQSVTVNAAGGTFKLTFSGQQTGALAWNITAVNLKTALEALSNIAPGDVIVTGGPGATAPLVVEFTGVYHATNVPIMVSDPALLTGGAGTAIVATTQESTLEFGNERMVGVVGVDSMGAALSAPTKAAILTYLDGLREVTFVVHVTDPTYTNIDVTTDVHVLPGFDAVTVQATVSSVITQFLSASTWGQPVGGSDRSGDIHAWLNDTVVRLYDVSHVIKGVDGVDYINSLTMAVHGAGLTAANVPLVGVVPLPAADVITVTSS